MYFFDPRLDKVRRNLSGVEVLETEAVSPVAFIGNENKLPQVYTAYDPSPGGTSIFL